MFIYILECVHGRPTQEPPPKLITLSLNIYHVGLLLSATTPCPVGRTEIDLKRFFLSSDKDELAKIPISWKKKASRVDKKSLAIRNTHLSWWIASWKRWTSRTPRVCCTSGIAEGGEMRYNTLDGCCNALYCFFTIFVCVIFVTIYLAKTDFCFYSFVIAFVLIAY